MTMVVVEFVPTTPYVWSGQISVGDDNNFVVVHNLPCNIASVAEFVSVQVGVMSQLCTFAVVAVFVAM